MNFIEEGKWLKLSKICYKNNYYQIFCSSQGVKTFLRIKEDGTYMYPSLSAYLFLTSKFNYENNGIFYDKDDYQVKLFLSNYFKFTLGITLYNYNSVITKKYVTFKDFYTKKIISQKKSKIKRQINKKEIMNYISDDYDLNYQLENNDKIDDKYKEIIKKYIKNTLNDLTIFSYNLSHLKIVEFEKTGSFKNILGYYKMFEYEIGLSKTLDEKKLEEVLFHELRHMTKVLAVETNNDIKYIDFKIDYNNIIIGSSLQEAINSKYALDNYYISRINLNLLSTIIPNDKLVDIEVNGDISNIIDILSSIYGTKEEALKIIMMIDEEQICYEEQIKYDFESKLEIKKMFMKYYFEKNGFILLDIKYDNMVKKFKNLEKNKATFKHYLKFNYNYNPIVGNLSTEELAKNDKIEICQYLNLFEKMYLEYITPFIKVFEFKKNRNNEIIDEIKEKRLLEEGFIFAERQIYNGVYIINDENFMTLRVKFLKDIIDDDDVYVYDIYIKKDYILDSSIDNILDYISLKAYKKVLTEIRNN